MFSVSAAVPPLPSRRMRHPSPQPRVHLSLSLPLSRCGSPPPFQRRALAGISASHSTPPYAHRARLNPRSRTGTRQEARSAERTPSKPGAWPSPPPPAGGVARLAARPTTRGRLRRRPAGQPWRPGSRVGQHPPPLRPPSLLAAPSAPSPSRRRSDPSQSWWRARSPLSLTPSLTRAISGRCSAHS